MRIKYYRTEDGNIRLVLNHGYSIPKALDLSEARAKSLKTREFKNAEKLTGTWHWKTRRTTYNPGEKAVLEFRPDAPLEGMQPLKLVTIFRNISSEFSSYSETIIPAKLELFKSAKNKHLTSKDATVLIDANINW